MHVLSFGEGLSLIFVDCDFSEFRAPIAFGVQVATILPFFQNPKMLTTMFFVTVL
jgi:hypothetical protein